jgi:4-hydroxy 2-oxovalerate aldolase
MHHSHGDGPVHILDVTLRDGGYINNHAFTLSQAKHIVENLADSGIAAVEVGYLRRRNAAYAERTGPSVCDSAYLTAVGATARAKGIRAGIMIRPHDTEPVDLLEAGEAGISLVRFACAPKDIASLHDYVTTARLCGMMVCVNIVRASESRVEDLVDHVSRIRDLGADCAYIADSNGSLVPEQVRTIFRALVRDVGGNLGFHAHDGLSFALANALEAWQCGAVMLDASLGGMGKGGNLATELLALSLDTAGVSEFRIKPLIEAVEMYVQPYIGPHCVRRIEYNIASTLNLNLDILQRLRDENECQPFVDVLADVFERRHQAALPAREAASTTAISSCLPYASH